MMVDDAGDTERRLLRPAQALCQDNRLRDAGMAELRGTVG